MVDPNILAYHCLPGPRNAETERLFSLDPEWAAPVLWRSEFRNVLGGYMRRGELSAAQAGQVIALATDTLKGGEHMVSDHAVLALVGQSQCAASDCEFVALAQALHCVLVTQDKALLKSFPKYCRSLEQILRLG